METDLTPKQKKVLGFLSRHLNANGFPPTLREIAFHFGLRGPKAPQKTLQILEKKGYIRRIPGGARAIEILKNVDADGRRGRSLRGVFQEEHSYNILSIPIVGRVTAGEPILAVENIEGHILLDRNLVSSGDVFLLRVQGDSMIDAHIQDGDFVLVKRQPNAENGEIVVALIEDEATIKRIFRKRDLIRLEPANPKMDPILVRKGEKKVTVVGKVVGIFRKI